MQIKNGAGEDTREGVYVTSSNEEELASGRGTCNFQVRWERGAKASAYCNVQEKVKGATQRIITGAFMDVQTSLLSNQKAACRTGVTSDAVPMSLRPHWAYWSIWKFVCRRAVRTMGALHSYRLPWTGTNRIPSRGVHPMLKTAARQRSLLPGIHDLLHLLHLPT
jgi:hypothetical protein